MIQLLLATSFALHAPADTGRKVIPRAPTAVYSALTSNAFIEIAPLVSIRARDADTALTFGSDKAQHFFMSYAVTSFAYAAARSVELGREPALRAAIAAVAVAGIGKELFDTGKQSRFSAADLIADALGGAAAYAMLKQIR